MQENSSTFSLQLPGRRAGLIAVAALAAGLLQAAHATQ